MSTHDDDRRVARHLTALAALCLAAVPALLVTLIWLFHLGCPKLWHVLCGPVALGLVIGLMAKVLESLALDPDQDGGAER